MMALVGRPELGLPPLRILLRLCGWHRRHPDAGPLHETPCLRGHGHRGGGTDPHRAHVPGRPFSGHGEAPVDPGFSLVLQPGLHLCPGQSRLARGEEPFWAEDLELPPTARNPGL